MTSYDTSLVIVDELTMEFDNRGMEVTATNDPRSATPPCVLIHPPNVVYDFNCGGTGEWELFILSPGTPNADAWKLLDEIEEIVVKLYAIERRDRYQYPLSSDGPPLFSYRLQLTKGID